MMVGDVTVVGLDVSTVLLSDIGRDVPHRAVVTIPADLATLSKDLWRAISQRRLFQLHAGPVGTNPVRPVVPTPVVHAPTVEVWQEKCRRLEQENAKLLATLARLEQEKTVALPIGPPTLDPRLDEILGLLKTGVTLQPGPVAPKLTPSSAVVEVDVPTFIPAEIKPKGFEGHLTDVQAETSVGSNLGSAASALRKLRKGK